MRSPKDSWVAPQKFLRFEGMFRILLPVPGDEQQDSGGIDSCSIPWTEPNRRFCQDLGTPSSTSISRWWSTSNRGTSETSAVLLSSSDSLCLAAIRCLTMDSQLFSSIGRRHRGASTHPKRKHSDRWSAATWWGALVSDLQDPPKAWHCQELGDL